MTLKIIGAGFGRTATLSLKQALEQLGFDKCYHMMEVGQNPGHIEQWSKAHAGEPINWEELFEGYQASVDWPSCNFWQEQAKQFPDAKILLSLRDADSWYASVMNTIYPSSTALIDSEDENMQKFGLWVKKIIWDGVFDGKIENKHHAINVFNRHNQSVIDAMPAERLLVFEAKRGWEPLCRFLEVEVPETDYPRVNTTEEFQNRS